MKITKRQLKRIIKEELRRKVFSESHPGFGDMASDDPNLAKIEATLNKLNLEGFVFVNLDDTGVPGEYHIGDGDDFFDLRSATGLEVKDIIAILEANGYDTVFDDAGNVTAIVP